MSFPFPAFNELEKQLFLALKREKNVQDLQLSFLIFFPASNVSLHTTVTSFIFFTFHFENLSYV